MVPDHLKQGAPGGGRGESEKFARRAVGVLDAPRRVQHDNPLDHPVEERRRPLLLLPQLAFPAGPLLREFLAVEGLRRREGRALPPPGEDGGG